MNGFKSVIPASTRVAHQGRDVKNELAFSIHKTGQNGEAAVFYIGSNLAKKARFILGDYLDVLKSDCGEYGLIKRTNNGGRRLSKTTSPNAYRLAVKKTNAFPIKNLTVLSDVSLEEDGLLFSWPKD
jgi:hypothetical protein